MRRLAPIRWLRQRPFFADALLATLFSVPLLAGGIAAERAAGEVVVALGCTVPLAWRRRYPVPVLVAAGAGTLLAELAFDESVTGFAVAVALYSTAAHAPRRQSLWCLALVLTGVPVDALLEQGPVLPIIVGNGIAFAAAWLLGDNRRSRRAYLAQLEERAVRAEAEREEMALRAVAEERTRIARELHDVVAHSMSVMVVQAGAARRLVETRPDDVKEALSTIEQTGRSALDEMRRLLGILRQAGDDSTTRTPQPGITDIGTLVTSVREAGLPVDLTIEGDPRPLAPGLDLSAYRIVQEALTNTLKHAGPATAQVRLCYGDDELEVRVMDDGRGPAADRSDGAGHGLVGMRERVAVFGGELWAGARGGGGFEVRARLPLEDR
jgi:signal transduction histidine kinase